MAEARLPLIASHIDLVVFDHGVGEQLFAGRLQLSFSGVRIRAGELNVEHLALPDARDAFDAKRLQRALDRLALRIEDAGFESNDDAGFHGEPMGKVEGFLTDSELKRKLQLASVGFTEYWRKYGWPMAYRNLNGLQYLERMLPSPACMPQRCLLDRTHYRWR